MSTRTSLAPPPERAAPPLPAAEPARLPADPPFARNVRAIFLGGLGSGAVRALRSVALSRLLGPAGYGHLDLALFYSRTAAALSRLGLAEATVRFGAALPAKEARSFARRAAKVVALASLLAGAAGALLAAPALERAGPRGGLVAALAFAAVPALAVAEVARAHLLGRQNFAGPAAIGFAAGLGAFALEALAALSGLGVPGMLGASLLATLGALAVYARAFRVEDGGEPGAGRTMPRAPEVVRYAAARLALGALTIVTWTRFEVVFLGAYWPAAEVAFYAVPFGVVGAAVELLPGSISAALPASYPERRARGGEAAALDLYRSAFLQMAAVGLPLAAAGVVLGPALVPLVFGPRFLPSAPVVGVLASGAVLAMVASAASHLVLSSSKAPWMLLVAGAGAAANLGLDLAWIPGHGAIGAAWANTTAQVFESALGVGAAACLFRAAPPARRLARLVPPLAACVGAGLLGARLSGGSGWTCAFLVAPAMAAAYVAVGRAVGAFAGLDAESLRALLPLLRRRR